MTSPVASRDAEPSFLEALAEPGVARSLLALFLAQAAATGALTTSVSLSSVMVTRLTGSAALSGLPATINLACAAMSAFAAGLLMARFGRRAGLVAGYGLGAVGATGGFAFALLGSLPGFLLANALVGAAQAVILQGRYAAADLVPAAARGRVVGGILFGAVIGALATTVLAPVLQDAGAELRVAPLVLAWAQSALMLAAGAVLVAALFRNPRGPGAAAARSRLDLDEFLRVAARPAIRLGVVTMVVGQAVMVMLMNLFPVHALHHGHPLGTITAIITAHIAGMFALAWLTGGLVDRFGAWSMGGAGGAMLIVGALLSALDASAVGLGVALYLIGLGWNLCFVSGSAQLAKALAQPVRARFQGAADVLVWLCAGGSTLGGGYLVGVYDYPAVGVLGGLAAAGLLLLTAFTWARLAGPPRARPA